VSTVTETLEARGLVLDRLGERPRLARLAVAPPGPEEVRVRMLAAGLCHTDVTQVRDARFTPILLGHEGAGEIESVGEGVSRPILRPDRYPDRRHYVSLFDAGIEGSRIRRPPAPGVSCDTH
jgi:hypothetical protein